MLSTATTNINLVIKDLRELPPPKKESHEMILIQDQHLKGMRHLEKRS
jgi:hypothetical protein